MPAAEIEVTVDQVRALVRAQHADLATLPITAFAHGWDNELFRLGDELVVRLPRRATAAVLIENELRWLPELAAHCSLPVPLPVRRGEAGEGYPYAWGISTYLPGEAVGDAVLDAASAHALGLFVRGIHVPAPEGAPSNPLRGVPLASRQARLDRAIATLGDRIDATRVREVWARCVATPVWSGPPVWIHGDLHPFNVLRDGARISGVIDFGDLGAGDPATDLAIAFIAFSAADRADFLAASGSDAATIERGRGWAIALGCTYAASDDPALGRIGIRAIAAATQ